MHKPQLLLLPFVDARPTGRRSVKDLLFVMLPTLLIVAPLLGQESDLVDTRDLAGRGIVFVTEETSRFCLDHVSAVGDVNGDGLTDLGLVHAVEHPVLDIKVYLIFGSSRWMGKNLIEPELPDSIHFTLPDLEATKVGASNIINVGDLNGDGYAEFAFALDNYLPPGTNGAIRGVFFIVHGQPTFEHTGEDVETIGAGIPGTAIYTTHPTMKATGFNGACAALDINGDRKSDLAIGGLIETGNRGIVHVLLGTTDLEPRVDLAEIGEALPGFTLETPGYTRVVTGAGDFNGDGLQDLLVADGRVEYVQNGSVYVFFGRPDPRGHYDLDALGESQDGVLRFDAPPSLDPGQLRFARERQAAGIGDLDGDGFSDLLMGEVYDSWNLPGGPQVDGRVHLVYGGSPPLRRTVIHGLGGASRRDQFGKSVSSPGDVNGDGIPDLLIGSPRRSGGGSRTGEAYLIHGRTDFPEEIHLADGFEGIRIPGDTADGGLGEFVGPAGDFNGDGNPDFLVGEPHINNSGEGGSKAFVIFGSDSSGAPLTVVSVEPRAGFVRGGARVRIRGSGFDAGAQVRFGTSEAQIASAVSTGEIEVVLPPAAGPGSVEVTVSVGGTTRTAPRPFEYVPDRPEIDLRNPGRWGLRVDGVPGFVIGAGLDFADIDGDGFDDLLIASNLVKDWVVTVIHGGRDLPETTDAFTPEPGKSLIRKRVDTERTFFEMSVRNVGDVNRDGIADFAVATRLESSYLFFGRQGLPAELDLEEEVEAGRAVRLRFDHQQFADFAPLGDLTGDGIDDFAMGLFSEVLLFVAGREDWPGDFDLYDESDPTSIFSRLREGPTFAAFLAPVGDATGDGKPDLLVSGNTGAGATIYLLHDLHSLPQGAFLKDYAQGGGAVRFDVVGQRLSAGNPVYVSAVGDVNGDGIADFLFAHHELTVGTVNEGITFLVHGRREFPGWIRFPFDMSPIDLEGVVRVTGAGLQHSGLALGPVGDYNADGHPDFMVAAHDLQLFPPAQAYVVFGSPELPPILELRDLGRHGFEIDGMYPHTRLSKSTRIPGDLNGDGAPDFAFSEYSTPFFPLVDGEVSRGSVHVILGMPTSVLFKRGDADGDGVLQITDAIFSLSFLFLGGPGPSCEDAVDTDDNGTMGIGDAIFLLNYLFASGTEPPPPHVVAGKDPTEDQLGCRGF